MIQVHFALSVIYFIGSKIKKKDYFIAPINTVLQYTEL